MVEVGWAECRGWLGLAALLRQAWVRPMPAPSGRVLETLSLCQDYLECMDQLLPFFEWAAKGLQPAAGFGSFTHEPQVVLGSADGPSLRAHWQEMQREAGALAEACQALQIAAVRLQSWVKEP